MHCDVQSTGWLLRQMTADLFPSHLCLRLVGTEAAGGVDYTEQGSCRGKAAEKPNTMEKHSATECQLPEAARTKNQKVPETPRARCCLLPSGRNLAHQGRVIEGGTGMPVSSSLCFLTTM